MMARYILHPGEVISADGDIHFIGALQLADCYNVSIQLCVVHDPRIRMKGIHLYPRSSGDYRLPQVEEEL